MPAETVEYSQLKRATQTHWKIRRSNENDAGAITECVNLAYADYADRIGKPPGPMTENYKQVIALHEVHVAESTSAEQGDIMGVLVLIASPERCLLDNVAVQPKAQGTGIGGSLIRFAENRAAQMGYDRLQLYTHELMTENLALYPKLGYREFRRAIEKGYSRVYFEKIFESEDLW